MHCDIVYVFSRQTFNKKQDSLKYGVGLRAMFHRRDILQEGGSSQDMSAGTNATKMRQSSAWSLGDHLPQKPPLDLPYLLEIDS